MRMVSFEPVILFPNPLVFVKGKLSMSLTMLQELIRFLASIGMVVVGSLFVLGVIYTGFERVVLRS